MMRAKLDSGLVGNDDIMSTFDRYAAINIRESRPVFVVSFGSCDLAEKFRTPIILIDMHNCPTAKNVY